MRKSEEARKGERDRVRAAEMSYEKGQKHGARKHLKRIIVECAHKRNPWARGDVRIP